MSKELIIIAPALAVADITSIILPDGTLALSEDAVQRKEHLLAEAAGVTAITTPSQRDYAIDVASRIKGEEDDAEEDREKAKSLFWKMCGAIDLTKKKHVAELTADRTRLNRLIGAFNEEQRMKAVREQQERDREAKRLADEAAAKQRELDRKAELLRKDQEALALKHKQAQERAEAKGMELTPEAKAKQLQADLDEQEKQEALEAQRKQQQEESDSAMRQLESEKLAAAEKARQEKPSGGAQLNKIDHEITDIKALYSAYPQCVKLVVNLSALNFLINSHSEEGFRIPGVIFSRHQEFSSRGR